MKCPTRPLLFVISLAGLLVCTSGHAEPPGNFEIIPKKLLSAIEASSSIEGYGAGRARDGRVSTAWISEAGQAVGATLTITYSTPRHVAWLTLSPGADAARYASHGRPAKVTVVWDGGEQRFDVPDKRGPYDLPIRGLARVSTLTLRVDAVHGPADAGVAISEMAAYEPYEVISVKSRRRMRMTDAVEAMRVEETPKPVKSVVALGPRVIPWLIAEIARGERLSAVRAFQALRSLDKKRAWRVAYNTLEKGEDSSAVAAAYFVGEGRAKDLADAVYQAYERLSGAQKLDVLGALARLGDPRALEVLVSGVRSGDATLTELAGEHLSAYGEEALFEIVALAGEPDPGSRARAVNVLIAWGGGSALQALCDLANSPDQAAGLSVITLLADARGTVARAALILLASEPAGAIRDAALEGLVRVGGGAVAELIAHGAQAGPAVNARVADALGRSTAPEVGDALVEGVLNSDVAGTNTALQSALAKHGKAGVRAVLKAIVTAPERATAAEPFLLKTYSRSAGVLAQALPGLAKRPALDPVRLVILKVLGHAQYVRAADAVADVYREAGDNQALRLVALQTASLLPGDGSKRLAREALANPDKVIAEAGLEAAIQLKDTEAGNILVERLELDASSTWPESAIESLARLKTEAAIQLFRRGMPTAPKALKLVMLRAAKRIGGKDATRFLVETSMSGEAEVSRTASQLLRSR
ncbi:MAG: HEAT repeat domain-containing protein [Myxococcota bacterium]